MKRVLPSLVLIFILLFSFAYSEQNDNLIANGDFSKLNASGMPENWSTGMWNTDSGVSSLGIVENGYDGNSACVINIDPNDARFQQTVEVEPDTVYYITCKVLVNGCSEEGYGASLSFMNTFVYSNLLYDTAGEWQELSIYGRTGEDQTEATVALRVGGYGNTNTGAAYFDDIKMFEADAIPEDVFIEDLSEIKSNSASADSTDDTEEETIPARNTEAYLLLTCMLAVLLYAVIRRMPRIAAAEFNARTFLMIGLIAAFVVRAILAVRVRGYNTDIGCFTAWSERIYAYGPSGFYSADTFCDYPPLYMLFLWIVSAIRHLTGISTGSAAYYILLKLCPIVFDLTASVLIYRYAVKKNFSEKLALIPALFYAFNPAVFVDSAAWGQIDSVFTLLLVICAVMADEDRFIASLVSFAAAVLIKPQALLFAPLGLFAILFYLFRKPEKKRFIRAGAGVVCAVGFIYIVALIFCIGNSNGEGGGLLRPVNWIIGLYSSTMNGYRYLTINALNLYTLLDLNWAHLDAQPVWSVFAWIMFGLAYAYSAFLTVVSKDRRRLCLCGAVLIVLVFTFGPMIHERYIFPAVLLLIAAWCVDRDRRLLVSFTVLTCTLTLNEILVLQGGMTTANYGHLQSSEQWLNAILSLVNVLNAMYLSYTALDICLLGHVRAQAPCDPISANPGEPRHDYRLSLKAKDIAIIAAVTLVYSAVAFTNLGTTKAPQTSWVSSCSGEAVTLDLGEAKTFRMIYYGGICNSTFTVELSNDAQQWTEPCYAEYDQGEIFRWIYYVPKDAEKTTLYLPTVVSEDGSAYITYASSDESYPMQTARYVRVTAQSAGLTLSEIGFLNEGGQTMPVSVYDRSGEADINVTSPELLIDEQDTVVDTPSYYNSTYFDEIYHARTGYELVHGMSIYEWTHPPLGKVIISLGIRIFGMTPFGWRFMGTLTGVLMLPLMYLLVCQLTHSKKLSLIAMVLMALDSMHFTQTRIATIDSFSVFWIMLEYFFMFRYMQIGWNGKGFRKGLLTLGLCGITMGAACATKWIGCYSAIGLAILFFWSLYTRVRDGIDADKRGTLKRMFGTLLFCIAFFIVIPVLIYYFSYTGQLRYEGVNSFVDMFSKERLNRVIELQKSMLGYHTGLSGDTHYFRSPWYQWPVIWWPMWYYSGTGYMPDGVISSISCMGNPAVWWTGLVSLIALVIMSAHKRKTDRTWLMVLIGFASQFLPWVLVPRSTFIYHYFASVPFIIICTVLVLDAIRKKDPKTFKWLSIALIVCALVLFAAFYPLESGTPVARSYAKYLRWFKWYNY